MTHQCKVQCHTVDPKTIELTGIEDTGKWLPFIFNLSIIDGAKMTSDDADSEVYHCTTIFTSTGDTYIIDTPYEAFFKKFEEFNTFQIIINDREEGGGDIDDLEL